MTEHHGEDTHLEEVPANQPAVAEDKDKPKRWKRGNYRGRKKLLDLEHEANKKSNQLAAIATHASNSKPKDYSGIICENIIRLATWRTKH